jgi:hypothetical protein
MSAYLTRQKPRWAGYSRSQILNRMPACGTSRSGTGTATGSGCGVSGATPFPHYWSALTAVALLDLPDELRSEDCEETAQAILQANLALYDENARGCCAFLYPSCVDGIPAHGADLLDNDQD